MRITFITTNPSYWGGSEELWVRLAGFFKQKGHQVQISIYPNSNGLHPKLKQLSKKIDSVNYLVNESDYKSLSQKLLLKVKKKLTDSLPKIKGFKPDLLFISQSNSFDVIYNQVFYNYLKKTNIPYYLLSQFNDEHLQLSYKEIEKAREVFKKAKTYHFVSKRNVGCLQHQIAVKLPNTLIVDNPLNLENIEYLEYPKDDIINFASVARFDIKFKAQDVIIQILASEKWHHRNWLLNLYGEGKDLNYLKDLVTYYKLNNRVVFHGKVNNIKEIWKKNHALLLPSVSEGKPLALEEAMVCGRIGIVSNVAGNSELIDDNIDGYISDCFLPISFDKTMDIAWGNKNKWNEMGKKAHHKLIKQLDFTPESTIYNHIIKDVGK